MTSLVSLTVSLGLMLSAPGGGSGTRVCHPMDETGSLVLAWIMSVVTQTDAAAAQQRAMMHLPLVMEREVTYVSDERICRSILSEYNKYSGTRDVTTGVESPLSERVCVVKIGTVYLATDPTKRFGEFMIWVTTDDRLRMLAHALG